MPFAQRVLSVWSDLQAAGGTYQATLTKVTSWMTTRRSDGNNQMALTVPLNTPGTDVLGNFSTPALVPPGAPPPPTPEVYDASDDFIATPPGSTEDLVDHTPTTPGVSGFTEWEYAGGSTFYQRDGTSGAVQPGASAFSAARTNIDVAHTYVRVWIDVMRLNLSGAAEEICACLHVLNESIGTWNGQDFIQCGAIGYGDNNVSFFAQQKGTGSGYSGIGGGPFAWTQNTGKRLIAQITADGTVTLSEAVYGTGAGETVIFTCPYTALELSPNKDDGNHSRVGWMSRTDGGVGTGWEVSAWGVESSGTVDPGVTAPISLVSVIGEGKVLMVEREDSSIEEWVVATYEDDADKDLASLTAVPMAAWVTERVRIRNGDVFTASFSGGLSDGLDNLLTLGNWPAWIIAGTVEVDPLLVVNYDRDNGTSALGKLVAAANATADLRLARVTARPVWRRVSATQWAVDILTSAVTGQPGIIEGSNLTKLKLSNDRQRAAQVIYPVNEDGTSIANAYWIVRAVNTTTFLIELRDWSHGPDNLLVLVDGQWVGQYLRAPDGTLYEITDSFAATQEIECASIMPGDINVGDMVGFAESDGSSVYAVALPGRLNPKQDDDERPWPTATNWALNAQFRVIEGSPLLPADWTDAGGSSGHFSIETDPAYRETGVQSLKWVSTATNEILLMDEAAQPQHFVFPIGVIYLSFGMTFYTEDAPGNLIIEYYITGSGSGSGFWGAISGGGLTSDGDWHTRQSSGFFFTPANGNTGVRLRVRASNAGTYYLDRVWLFLEDESADNRVEGNGPTRGVFEGNRTLSDRADGGLAYQVGFLDRHRENPSLYPEDRIEVDQLARLVAPIRDIDTLLPVTQLVVDEYKRHATQVTVGAIPRRLTDLI